MKEILHALKEVAHLRAGRRASDEEIADVIVAHHLVLAAANVAAYSTLKPRVEDPLPHQVGAGGLDCTMLG